VSAHGIRDRKVLIVRLAIRLLNTRSNREDSVSMRPCNADSRINIIKPGLKYEGVFGKKHVAGCEVERHSLIV
jgi:hypothetical protein